MTPPIPAVPPDEIHRGLADWAWAALAATAALFVAVNLVGTIVVLVTVGLRSIVWQGPLWALAAWWINRGAWLRTSWGRPEPGTPPPWDEPGFAPARAAWFTWLAAAAVVAAAVALGLQAWVLAS